MTYKGRFAPSPSGRLHFGSIVCAVAVFLRAKSQDGLCCLRIEDLDLERCKTGNTKAILDDLNTLGFVFDGEVLIQTQNTKRYLKQGDYLFTNNEAFYCSCTRALLKQRPCTCSSLHLEKSDNTALFYKVKNNKGSFNDALRGEVFVDNIQNTVCLIRKDGIISYNLACVTDDIDMGITEIVRGADLIDITPVQIEMYEAFKACKPNYLHIPLALMDENHKLSKQNHSKAALDLMAPEKVLIKALEFLNQDISNLHTLSCRQILQKAADRFTLSSINTTDKVISIN